jgi:hypothetical protein
MNRTVVFLAFASIALVGVVGIILIIHLRPDATATLISAISQILGMVSAFAVVAYGLGKLNEKVDTVRTQTNGTLSAKEDRIKRLEKLLISEGIDPHEETHDPRAAAGTEKGSGHD